MKQAQLKSSFKKERKSLVSTPTMDLEQLKRRCVDSVHEFIGILKEALFRFYRVNSIMKSQDDDLNALVASEVLD